MYKLDFKPLPVKLRVCLVFKSQSLADDFRNSAVLGSSGSLYFHSDLFTLFILLHKCEFIRIDYVEIYYMVIKFSASLVCFLDLSTFNVPFIPDDHIFLESIVNYAV